MRARRGSEAAPLARPGQPAVCRDAGSAVRRDAGLPHDHVRAPALDDALDALVFMSGQDEEPSVGALDRRELVRVNTDRPDAVRVRALADDVDLRELLAKAVRHLDDLLVHRAKDQLVLRSAYLAIRCLAHSASSLAGPKDSAAGNSCRSGSPSVSVHRSTRSRSGGAQSGLQIGFSPWTTRPNFKRSSRSGSAAPTRLPSPSAACWPSPRQLTSGGRSSSTPCNREWRSSRPR